MVLYCTYQPLLVPLRALGVPQLDGDLLRLEPRLGALGHGAPVHGPEPSFPEEVAVHEPLGRRLEVADGEHVQVRPGERHRQVLVRRRAHHVRQRQPLLQPRGRGPGPARARRRQVLPRARTDLAAAAAAQAAAEDEAPHRPILLLLRLLHLVLIIVGPRRHGYI
jgi:hypothetical protein